MVNQPDSGCRDVDGLDRYKINPKKEIGNWRKEIDQINFSISQQYITL